MLLPSTTLFRSPFPSFPSLPSCPASRPPPVEAHERWCVGQLVQAFHVQALGVGGFEELREQLGHAAGADHVVALAAQHQGAAVRSEEHTSELQSLMRISYAVFCLKKKKHTVNHN